MSTTLELQPIPSHTHRNEVSDPFEPAADAQVARAKQKWNEPNINKYRLAATSIAFALVGASDGVYGV